MTRLAAFTAPGLFSKKLLSNRGMSVTTMGMAAGPSSPLQRAASTASNSLQDDQRGYPQRTYATQILRIDPGKVRITSNSSKGKEAMHDVHVIIDDKEQECNLQRASNALQQAHLVAFPTETVYGLAGNALDANAVQKIFHAKGRPADNPLIVHISHTAMLKRLVADTYNPNAAYQALMQAFWPGPLTLLMPVDERKVPSVVRCGLNTLGVRMPSHPVAQALIARSNLPLAAPSANVSGKPSPTIAHHVFHDMTEQTQNNESVVGRLPFIIDGGASEVGLESTVVDGVTDPNEIRVLRPGGVSVEKIEQALASKNLLLQKDNHVQTDQAVRVRVYGKDMAKDAKEESTPTTPGMKYRHYSPDAQVTLFISKGTDAENAHVNESYAGSARQAASQALGRDVAQRLLVRPAKQIVDEQVAEYAAATGKADVHVGFMSLDGSQLTKDFLGATERHNDSFHYTPRSCAENGKAAYTLHGFSLGSSDTLEEAAHRLFQGLRSLDGGDSGVSNNLNGNRDGKQNPSVSLVKCDLIFVEALSRDDGVALAIMNRLNKAASQTFIVE